jgi:hypothetical protein
MTEPVNPKMETQKRTNAEATAQEAEGTPTPQQRAVLERYLKRRDSRPGAPSLSVKSRPNQPIEISQLSLAGIAGLELAFGTTEAAAANSLLNSLMLPVMAPPAVRQRSKTSTRYLRRFMGWALTMKSRRCWQSRWLRRTSPRHVHCAV